MSSCLVLLVPRDRSSGAWKRAIGRWWYGDVLYGAAGTSMLRYSGCAGSKANEPGGMYDGWM